jgi:hypothetical protein
VKSVLICENLWANTIIKSLNQKMFMKKIIFLFFLSLWGLGGFSALASVTVTPLSTDFTNKKVTFRVEYANAVNNRAWVWIDLCPVSGVTPSAFQTAVISAASATGNNVLYASTNTRGFFVTASPATVTATLSNADGKFNWCAYGSDAPPNVTAANGTYTFKGTPPFILTAANGTTAQTVTGKILPTSALTMTPVTLTDKTGYPGVFCIYMGSDLFIDDTHLCQQRIDGAKNWEAWIKDTRDNQLYRIVQMSTGTWWMAQDLMWDGKPNPTATSYTVRGTARSCGAYLGCGRTYNAVATGAGAFAGNASTRRESDVCPQNWLIPSTNELCPIATYEGTTSPYLSAAEFGGPDTYGLSLFCCARGGYNCGTSHTNLIGSTEGGYRFYRSLTGDRPLGYGECTTQIINMNVRCVRNL